jgi:hypothetical protein
LHGLVAKVPKASFEPSTDSCRAVRQFLWDCVADHATLEWDATVLLAGELAAIATVRSRLTFDVCVEVSAPCVWVCVEDLSAILPRPQAGELGVVDRHMLVVETVADRWGFELTDAGARVWFEMCGGRQ